MKINVISIVWITTIVVFTNAILANTGWMPWLMAILAFIGPPLIIYMVLRVLKDDYSTNLTFNDWYRDKPKE
jgi:hypothetical protein